MPDIVFLLLLLLLLLLFIYLFICVAQGFIKRCLVSICFVSGWFPDISKSPLKVYQIFATSDSKF